MFSKPAARAKFSMRAAASNTRNQFNDGMPRDLLAMIEV
jgi:hypothetical protein